jgi:hypothetical protein
MARTIAIRAAVCGVIPEATSAQLNADAHAAHDEDVRAAFLF